MASKLNKSLGVLILIFCFHISLSAQTDVTDSLYVDENNVYPENSTESDQEAMDSDGNLSSGKDMQQVYESVEPKGVETDENKIKKLADKLNYSEKVKPKDKNKKKEPEPFQIKTRRSDSGSMWLGEGGKTIVYTLAIVALVGLIVFLILRASKGKVNKEINLATVQTADITDADRLASLDLDEMLSEAAEKADYRMAIRLLYLNSLKLLMEKGLLKPSPEKTNFDYVRELSGYTYQSDFRSTTGIFEKIWYGESELNTSNYQWVKNRFADFQDKIRIGK